MLKFRTIALVLSTVLLYSSTGWAAPATKEVEVVNDLLNPVPIEDVDNPARQPFQTGVSITNAFNPQGFAATITTIPSGSRLVIEFLSASCSSTGTEPTEIRVTTNVDHFFSLEDKVFGAGFSSVATHLTRMYAEPSSDVNVTVFPTTGSPFISCNVSITGYFIEP
jgi:hypothetical protein